ncbi:glycoside hydrolase family 68 protein [Salinigranum salinum]|uniref:glycoside hydrolase family 68 protein n=1 Tax=Salinigranum salinum TaxID=1364937 RepID=UPI001260F832|nr:glycoside hydrolase family 68 protein [Salinigranum salinum]
MSERPSLDTTAWTREHAHGIERTDDNTAPIIYPPAEKTDPDNHIWDTWLLRTPGGEIAEVNGYRVIVALSAPNDLLPGKRHDVATHRFYYSTDGRQWTPGGRVFGDTDPLGSRQWAGSAIYDPSTGAVSLYYTAAGSRGEDELSYTQRLAVAHGGSLVVDEDDGVSFEGPWTHDTLARPDGEWYEREEQSRGMIYTFRDPWYFEDPETGEAYVLFEGNTPVPEGSEACDGDPVQQEFNGSVGIARAAHDEPTACELLPPLIDGVCVNQELERPHVVYRDGTYYLFIASHKHTFAPGLDGYDALYGFAADALFGEYEPLNGSGLVLTNPANAPFQAYSWLAYGHRDEILVTSFFNYYDYDRPSLDDVGLFPEPEQFRRFGGTLAPTVRLGVDGHETWIRGTLDHGHLPTRDEELPETIDERIGRLRGGHDRDRGGYGH